MISQINFDENNSIISDGKIFNFLRKFLKKNTNSEEINFYLKNLIKDYFNEPSINYNSIFDVKNFSFDILNSDFLKIEEFKNFILLFFSINPKPKINNQMQNLLYFYNFDSICKSAVYFFENYINKPFKIEKIQSGKNYFMKNINKYINLFDNLIKIKN